MNENDTNTKQRFFIVWSTKYDEDINVEMVVIITIIKILLL